MPSDRSYPRPEDLTEAELRAHLEGEALLLPRRPGAPAAAHRGDGAGGDGRR